MRRDNLLEQHEPQPLRRAAARQCDDAIEQRGHLHHREQLLARIGILHQQDDVQALVVDVREGMARIDGQRREHRIDLLREQLIEVLALGGIERLERHPLDPRGREPRHDLTIEQAVLLGDERVHPCLDT